MIYFAAKLLDRCAAGLLLAVAATAPWLAGAQPVISQTGWWYVAGLAGSLGLAAVSCVLRREFLRVPRLVLWSVILLLGCLVWWAGQPEPNFPTVFSAEQWAALKMLVPGGFINVPRGLRLAMTSALLFGLLAAAHLGADPGFRKILLGLVGWMGLAVAACSLCERFLGWNHPSWVIVSDGGERFNAAFFHYSAAAACVNLAWPLLVFRSGKPTNRAIYRSGYWAGIVATAGLAWVAVAFWEATSAKWVASGLMLFGGAWFLLDRFKGVGPKVVAGTVFGGFAVALLAQMFFVHALQDRRDDGWQSVAVSKFESEVLDARLKAMVAQRGDRLIPNEFGDRETAWLATLRMVADQPLLGDGPGSRAKRLRLYTNNGFVNSFYLHLQFAHHDLLQTAAEWGLVPLIGWLAIWLIALRACVNDAVYSRGLLLALLGVAVHGLVDFPLQVPALQMWTALLLGLGVAPRQRGKQEPDGPRQGRGETVRLRQNR